MKAREIVAMFSAVPPDAEFSVTFSDASARPRPKTDAERAADYRASRRVTAAVTKSTDSSRNVTAVVTGGKGGSPCSEKAEESEKVSDPAGSSEIHLTGSDLALAPTGAQAVTKRHVTRDAKNRPPRRGPLWNFVPAGWAPNAKHCSDAIGLLLDVEAEAAKFRDHEFSPPRSDPDRAFSGWLRRAREFNFRAGRAANGNKTDLQKILERAERIQKGAAE